jgi:hypothetical protein
MWPGGKKSRERFAFRGIPMKLRPRPNGHIAGLKLARATVK